MIDLLISMLLQWPLGAFFSLTWPRIIFARPFSASNKVPVNMQDSAGLKRKKRVERC
ncbi:hypothetical protein ACVWZR_002270 [Bradyrhizobium sp. i1.3.1]